MNKIICVSAVVIATAFTACNGGKDSTAKDEKSKNAKDSAQHEIVASDENIKIVAVQFVDVDQKVAASLKEVVDHYLHIKNALVNDNAKEAASGGNAMVKALGKLDKSLLTAGQKKILDENYDDLKTHAGHIEDNAGNIKHQRGHFADMSENMYDLVRAFGSGQALYHDHCPMAEDNTGAMWLSETREVKNPYFGAQMPTCGTVEEKIEK